jgi:UDP-glucuronate decarboxylase
MRTPASVTGPINIGNPVEFTILDLATLVIGLTNTRSQIVRRPLPADDPRQRQPDLTLAKQVLGWSAPTSLRNGLVPTIAYFDRLLSNPSVREMLI